LESFADGVVVKVRLLDILKCTGSTARQEELRVANREAWTLDFLRHQTNHELATFAPLIPTNVQSVRQTLHYLSSLRSITFLSRTFLKPRFLAVQCGFVGKSTITPPHPSYQYSIREAERNYKERLHFN